MSDKPNVIVLCTGNSARSQMGEAFIRQYLGHLFNVYSAGLDPKGMNPYTVRVMDEIGVDVRGQASESVADYMGKMPFAYAITVCGHADEHCPSALWAGGEKLHWAFDDPASAEGDDETKLGQFRTIRDAIQARVIAWANTLNTPIPPETT